jgi:hypothetical protein
MVASVGFTVGGLTLPQRLASIAGVNAGVFAVRALVEQAAFLGCDRGSSSIGT